MIISTLNYELLTLLSTAKSREAGNFELFPLAKVPGIGSLIGGTLHLLQGSSTFGEGDNEGSADSQFTLKVYGSLMNPDDAPGNAKPKSAPLLQFPFIVVELSEFVKNIWLYLRIYSRAIIPNAQLYPVGFHMYLNMDLSVFLWAKLSNAQKINSAFGLIPDATAMRHP